MALPAERQRKTLRIVLSLIYCFLWDMSLKSELQMERLEKKQMVIKSMPEKAGSTI
jgi:hypothetical protein